MSLIIKNELNKRTLYQQKTICNPIWIYEVYRCPLSFHYWQRGGSRVNVEKWARKWVSTCLLTHDILSHQDISSTFHSYRPTPTIPCWRRKATSLFLPYHSPYYKLFHISIVLFTSNESKGIDFVLSLHGRVEKRNSVSPSKYTERALGLNDTDLHHLIGKYSPISRKVARDNGVRIRGQRWCSKPFFVR